MAKTSRRAGPPMAAIHDLVFEQLRQWRAETSDANRLFYLRRNKDERFEQGYWFPGNDDYLNISFWSGSDTKNKTSNAYFQIHAKYGCRAMLTARESGVKRDAFKEFVRQFGADGEPVGYDQTRKDGEWVKKYSFHPEDFAVALVRYLKDDKPRLDAFLAARSGRIGEEHETPFGFLNEQEFNDSLKQTLTARELRQRSEPMKVIVETLPKTHTLNFGVAPDPYRLTMLSVRSFQGIKHAEVNNLPPAPWVFLTGDNGFGKTSVLRAIALGLSSPEAGAGYWGSSPNGSIEAFAWQGKRLLPLFVRSAGVASSSISEKQLSTNPTTLAPTNLDGRVLAYGPNRLPFQSGDEAKQAGIDQPGIASLFGVKQTIALRHFDSELLEAQAYEDQVKREKGKLTVHDHRVTPLIEVIVKATDGQIQDAKIDLSSSERAVLYTERITAEDGSSYTEERRYDELATGLRGIINLVTDIYARLTAAQNTRQADALVGIVIIDELENHLHPRLQRALPGTLSAVFPGVQFIVSTHSPIPFLGAPKGSIFLRVNRDKERGITVAVVPQDVDFTTLLPNAILTSPLFGFESILSDNVQQDLPSLKTDDSYDEAVGTERLREKFLKIKQREQSNA